VPFSTIEEALSLRKSSSLFSTAGLQIQHRLVTTMMSLPSHTVKLQYRFQGLEEAEGMSGWLLSYYERIHFIGITGPVADDSEPRL
jgi:hypothetical protein